MGASAPRAWVGVALLALSSACPQVDYPDIGPLPDGFGVDVDERDAPLDAPTDGSIDGGPADPGWTQPPGLPDGCIIQRARHPERLSTVGATHDCGPGCARTELGQWYANGGYWADGEAWLRLDSESLRADEYTTLLVDRVGRAGEAWTRPVSRGFPRCGVFGLAVGGERIATVVMFLAGDAGGASADYAFVRRRAAAPVVAGLRVESVGGVQEVAVSSDLVGLRIGSGEIAVAVDGETSARAVELPTRGGAGFDISVTGSRAVFAEAYTEWRLLDWTPTTGTRVYYDPPNDVGNPRLDGTTLVWAQFMDFVGGMATRAELWTGEFVTDPADFAPRRVHRSVDPTRAVLGDQTYAWQVAPGPASELRVVDLATGTLRSIRAPDDVGCDRILYTSRHDVAAACYVVGRVSERSVYHWDPAIAGTVVVE